jgi:hypothetical protein
MNTTRCRFIFSKRGAYGRFKDLLDYRGQLDAWYEHERRAAERALREWAAENGLAVGAAHRRP